MSRTRVHQGGTKTFDELTFAEQQKSINMAIINIKRTIAANKKRAASEKKPDPTQSHIKKLLKIASDLLDTGKADMAK